MKVLKTFFIIFLIVGLLFLGIGFLVFDFFDTNKGNEISTTAVITDMDSYRRGDGNIYYDVFITYEINDEIYETKLNEYSSDYYVGKELEIYYKEDQPYDVHTKLPIEIALIICGIFSLIFILIGGIGIICILSKERKVKMLRKSGEIIYATYKNVSYNKNLMINGRHPYNIICEYTNPMDGTKYLFKSENIWENPEYIIKEKDIITFPVYVNKNSFEEYVVDIDAIKEQRYK